jgi:hypothetical protein
MKHLNIDETNYGSPVQTYLITYPLFDMSLDFNEYLKGTRLDTDANRVPPVDISIEISNQLTNAVNLAFQQGKPQGADLPYSDWIDPFQGNPPEVDLGDMKNLLSDITFNTGTSFTIKVSPENAEQMKEAIRIRVPRLKIGGEKDIEASWVKGELKENNTKLVFMSSITETDKTTPLLLLSTGTPQEKDDSEKIEVHVRLVNEIGAGTYETELNFDWYSVQVTPNDNSKKSGEFKGFNLGSYLSNLGDNVEFETIPAYLYVTAPSSIGGFNDVKIDGANAPGNSFTLKTDDIKGENLPSWLDETPKYEYDFASIVNKGDSIKYTIETTAATTLYRHTLSTDTMPKITANLAVLLPMVFKFPKTGEFPINDEDGTGWYLPIKFQGLDDFLGNGSDTGDTNVMEEIDKQLGEGGVNRLTLRLRDIKNGVTSSIYLATVTDPTIKSPAKNDWEIVEIANGGGKDIEIKNVASLSALPPIKFLIKEDGQGQGGRLYIQSQETEGEPAFSVKISVVAGVNLDKKIDL